MDRITYTADEVQKMIQDERKACAKIAAKIAWKAIEDKERTGLPTLTYMMLDGQASAALEIEKFITERGLPPIKSSSLN